MAQEMSIKRVLLSDVAKLAGLSKATLSRYMNNSIVLPQDTIDRIETAIRELDYRGNSTARRLSKGGSERGTVLPDITNPFFAELADAAEEAASASGYAVLCITRNNPEKCQFIRWLDTCRSTVCCSPPTAPIMACCARKSSVTNGLSCWMKIFPAVRYRKCLPITSGAGGSPPKTDRRRASPYRFRRWPGQADERPRALSGLCTAMEQAGLSWPPEWVMYGDYQREFGQQALRYLFSQQVRPTAVFAASDYLVLGLLDGLRASGLRRQRRYR